MSNVFSKRLIDPLERISEVWFGLIMVLTFTCSLSVKQAGRTEVREMLIDALGCNIAWGIIDACMYLFSSYSEHGRNILALRELRAAGTLDEAQGVVYKRLPTVLATLLAPDNFDVTKERLMRLPATPAYPELKRDDWLAALWVFLLVFLSTLPVVIPFMFQIQPGHAMRISNTIAIVMLFFTGYAFGREAGYRPWRMGFITIALGCFLVAITIRLGG